MNTTQNSENSFESLYDECLGARKTPTTHVVSEEAFDGDFDSLAGEIKSLENLVDFASAYEDLQAYHADQKIRMLKKLKVATRGTTSYHASVESYLDHELSLEVDAAPNTENGPKVDNPNTEKSGKVKKFFADMWEKIKIIFGKICDFIKTVIDNVVSFFRDKFGSPSGISNDILKCEKEDPETFKEMVDALGTLSFEEVNKSVNERYITLNNNSISNFNNSVDAYKTVCSKFKQLVQECTNGHSISSSDLDHCRNLISVISNIFGIPIDVSINGSDKDSIKSFNNSLKAKINNLDYEKDPANFIARLCGAKLIDPKSKRVSQVYGTTNPKEIIKICNDSKAALKGVSDGIFEHKKIVSDAYNTFTNYLRTNKIMKGDTINENYNNDKNPEKFEDKSRQIEYTAVIITIGRYLLKVENIFKGITADYIKSYQIAYASLLKVGKLIKDAAGEAAETGKNAIDGMVEAGKNAGSSIKDFYNDFKQKRDEKKLQKHLEKQEEKEYKEREREAKKAEKNRKAEERQAEKNRKAEEKEDARRYKEFQKNQSGRAENNDAEYARREKIARETAEKNRANNQWNNLREGNIAKDVKKFKEVNPIVDFDTWMSDRGYSSSEISKGRGMLSWSIESLNKFIEDEFNMESWFYFS